MSRNEGATIELHGWTQVRDSLRAKDLRQAGYTQGAVVMADCLLDLHGPNHRERRRLENRLFRREVFSHWEHEVLGSTVKATLGPFVEAGRGDLAQIGYRSAMNLTATIAGIDHDPTDGAATEYLYGIVKKFSEGATIMHSTRDKQDVMAEVKDAMRRFEFEVYEPSRQRRQELVARCDRGELDEAELPKDVLTTLLRNQDRLDLPPDVMMREICFYLQAGAHSTANAFTHTVDDLLAWGAEHPEGLELARSNLAFVQRGVHESLRLNPASPVAYRSPVADVTLSDGTELPAGALVILDLTSANRDITRFGTDANRYNPHREIKDGVPRWGMSFGAGTHACIGAELDGGLEIDPNRTDDEQLYGTVAVMAHAFLQAGGRQDPEDLPELDPSSTRKHYGRYPVVF
ncbi:MAG: cytochrome P450 [Acidimicrobiaceae bacterium]|nr:cytochrome P450 [Acidimicrobiaceae bacterium]